MLETQIGMKHENIVALRDKLTAAIDANPEGRDGGTEVVMYGDCEPRGHVLTISNDDMERDEVPAEVVWVEHE